MKLKSHVLRSYAQDKHRSTWRATMNRMAALGAAYTELKRRRETMSHNQEEESAWVHG
jgi:predicted secreted protein